MCRLIFKGSKNHYIDFWCSLKKEHISFISYILLCKCQLPSGVPYCNYWLPLPREIAYLFLSSPSFCHGSESSLKWKSWWTWCLLNIFPLSYTWSLVLCFVRDMKGVPSYSFSSLIVVFRVLGVERECGEMSVSVITHLKDISSAYGNVYWKCS